MKLLIWGDLQLNDRPPHDRVNPKTNRSTRFDEGVAVAEGVVDAALAAGAEGMVMLGDLTEHKHPSPLESRAAAHLFTRMMDKSGFVWAIAGNHDGALFHQTSSSIEPLARMRQDQFKLYHEVEVDTELGMLAVPYIHGAGPDQIRVMIENAWTLAGVQPNKNYFGAIHYGGKGAVQGYNNMVVEKTDYLSPEQMLVRPLDHVFGGHIHKAQDFAFGSAHFWHPGSVVTQNRGERADGKTWILFDTVTRKVEVFPIKQSRRFVVVPYHPSLAVPPQETAPLWGPDDIVSLTGSYATGDYPSDTLAAAYKMGVPEPFSMDLDEVKVQRPERKASLIQVDTDGGLHAAIQSYVKEKYANHTGEANLVGPATAMAMDCIRDSGLQTYVPTLHPVEMTIKNLLTIRDLKHTFTPGEAVIITGENGKGKTNFLECMLWIQHGETSKGVQTLNVANRNSDDGMGEMIYEGSGPEGVERYRVTRSIKISKAGKASQKLRFDRWRNQVWEDLSDGGVKDVQRLIDALVGGSYQSVKTTAFKFQVAPQGNASNPFLSAHPSERKAILGEILGLAPLYQAHKTLDKQRQESSSALRDAESRLSGMVALGDDQDARAKKFETELAVAEAAALKAKADLEPAEMAETVVKLNSGQAKLAEGLIQAEIDKLPNSEAKVTAAQSSVDAHKKAYEASRELKVERFRADKASIEAAEKELAGLSAPDPAKVASLEIESEAAKKGHEEKRAAAAKLREELSGADATARSKTETTKTARDAAEAAAFALAQLPTASVLDEAQARELNVSAEAEVAEHDKEILALAGQVVGIQSSMRQLGLDALKLQAELEAFSGKDIDNCSRCGQKVNSAHIKKEIERINGELNLGAQQLVDLKTSEGQVQKDLGKLTVLKSALQAVIKDRNDALQAQAGAAEKLAAARSLAGATHATHEAAAAAEIEAGFEVERLKASLAAVEPLEAAAKTKALKLSVDLATWKAQGTTIGALQGKLEALRQQQGVNVAEGKAETEAYEKESARLIGELGQAQAAHVIAQAQADALRGQLAEARKLSETAAADLVKASVALQAAKGALESEEQKATAARDGLKAIEDQKKAVEEAKFELATMKQRAEIDILATQLLDPKTGLPAHLVDRYLPFLEDRINLYMEQMGKGYLVISFAPFEDDKDSLAIMVDDGQPGRKLEIRSYSGGEGERIEYSVKFSMADLVRQVRGVTFGLMCFDEPSGGLHAGGREALIRIIRERVTTYPVTLIITHDDTLIRSFDQRMEFVQGGAPAQLVAA